MIPVTRLDGTVMILNSDQIAWIECSPDTVVSLRDGEKLIVRESPDLLVARVVEFRRAIASNDLRRPGFPNLLRGTGSSDLGEPHPAFSGDPDGGARW